MKICPQKVLFHKLWPSVVRKLTRWQARLFLTTWEISSQCSCYWWGIPTLCNAIYGTFSLYIHVTYGTFPLNIYGIFSLWLYIYDTYGTSYLLDIFTLHSCYICIYVIFPCVFREREASFDAVARGWWRDARGRALCIRPICYICMCFQEKRSVVWCCRPGVVTRRPRPSRNRT